jgi:multiple sugar transport system substrate-binding protein
MLWAGIALFAFVLVGCGGETKQSEAQKPTATQAPEANKEPVTLKLYYHSSPIEEDEFNKLQQAVRNKFPLVTLEWIPKVKGVEIEDLIASGNVPDIIGTGVNGLPRLRDSDLPMDLRAQVKQHAFNVQTYIPEALKTVEGYGANGELFGLPYKINYFATTYNKSIFNKFGVPYPKDGITWDEAIELAKKLTRSEGGIQYRGLVAGTNLDLFGWELGLAKIDPKTHKASLNSDGWLLALNTFKNIYSIPGNEGLTGLYLEKGNIAMSADYGRSQFNRNIKAIENGSALDWDLTSYPVFKESPVMPISTDIYLIVKTSKHPSEAFDVISWLTTDPTVLSDQAKQTNMPAIAIKNVDKIFGQDNPGLKGKNVAVLFKSKYQKMTAPTLYEKIGQQTLNKYAKKYVAGEMDARSALAAADEEVNQQIKNGDRLYNN